MKRLKNRVRLYIIIALLIFSFSTVSYLHYVQIRTATSLDVYFSNQAETFVERLKLTVWGNTSRGKNILNTFNKEEFSVITPRLLMLNGKRHYFYNSKILESASSGAMVKYVGQFTIYIGLYHSSELNDVNHRRIVSYMDFSIPEDEFIHILIDELVSRYWEGKFFIEGEASIQEERDAWNAAEEAVKAYYNNNKYFVRVHSSQPPGYGPSSDKYIKIQ
jgi:hypothetical protein